VEKLCSLTDKIFLGTCEKILTGIFCKVKLFFLKKRRKRTRMLKLLWHSLLHSPLITLHYQLHCNSSQLHVLPDYAAQPLPSAPILASAAIL
jgi:hypothetical protein